MDEFAALPVPGSSIQLEFREQAKAGLAPLEVLRSATTAPARYLGRTGRMGRIAAGTDADLVLLDADLLASLDNLASISLVVRGGHPFTAGGSRTTSTSWRVRAVTGPRSAFRRCPSKAAFPGDSGADADLEKLLAPWLAR